MPIPEATSVAANNNVKGKAHRVRLDKLELDLKKERDNYLKSYGWDWTCATPGSLWLWRRDFITEDHEIIRRHNKLVAEVRLAGREYKGSRPLTHGIVLCDTDTAMTITERYLEGFDYND